MNKIQNYNKQKNFNMKNKMIITVLLVGFHFISMEGLCSDTTKSLHRKTFKTTVVTDKTTIGYIMNFSDSSVIVSASPIKFNPLSTGSVSGSSEISYQSISNMKIRRKGSVGRGALIGGLSGMAAGVISGFIAGDDKIKPVSEDPWQISAILASSAGDKALAFGLLGLVSGGVIGAIIGAISNKKYTINGNKDKFDDMREKILNKAYKSNPEN